MKMMKSLNVMFLLLVMAMAVGCGGSDDPEPDNSGQNNKCLITKKYSQSPNGQKILANEILYDNNRRLVRQNMPGGSYILYNYDTNGLIITAKSFNPDDTLTVIHIYEHNSNGHLINHKAYAKNTMGDPITFQAAITQEFNPSMQIIKRSMFGDVNLTLPTNYINYSYLQNGTVKEELYVYTNNVPVLTSTTIKEFDDKNAPTIFNFYKDGLGNHNVLSSTINWTGTTSKNEAFYKYKYNSDNYPTEVTRMKSDSTVIETIYYEYSCI